MLICLVSLKINDRSESVRFKNIYTVMRVTSTSADYPWWSGEIEKKMVGLSCVKPGCGVMCHSHPWLPWSFFWVLTWTVTGLKPIILSDENDTCSATDIWRHYRRWHLVVIVILMCINAFSVAEAAALKCHTCGRGGGPECGGVLICHCSCSSSFSCCESTCSPSLWLLSIETAAAICSLLPALSHLQSKNGE